MNDLQFADKMFWTPNKPALHQNEKFLLHTTDILDICGKIRVIPIVPK
jgi:hypothetical protein